MTFETIDEGRYSAITDAYFGFVTNEIDWMALCRRHHGNTMEIAESGSLRPLTQFHDRFSVNFREEVVVYVFMGQKAPSCYNVQIQHITNPVNARSTVHYSYVKKAFDVVTMGLTSPFHIVKVEKSYEHCSNFNFNEVPDTPPVPRVPEILQDAMKHDLTGMKLYNILEVSYLFSKLYVIAIWIVITFIDDMHISILYLPSFSTNQTPSVAPPPKKAFKESR